MAELLAWLAVVISVVAADVTEGPSNTTDSSGTEEPAPVHSMHRLISSVIDTESPRGNKSEPFSPGNITLDTSPFLPSGLISSYRSVQPYQPPNNVSNSASQTGKNFTPSFFIGEVIPEPYVPERFQTSRSGEVEKNTSNRSNQKLVPSQTAFAFQKILPFLEHMKHAVSHSMGHGHEDEPFDHVPPVHEPSAEDEDSSTPKYAVSYEDQHSDRPSYLPHYHSSQNFHSTKPITFDNGGQHFQQDSPGYPPYDPRVNANDHYGHPGQSDHYKNHNAHFGFNGTSVPSRDHAEQYSGPFFAHDNHEYLQKDHLDHFSHHDVDFVLPSPFYPPEPEHPSSHHKDVHYKDHQNKPKSPLHGLLQFAAALIPLGLFVAALQPSVMHVNSSQPMPPKYRSADGGGGGAAGGEVLGLPGLEALERLGLGRLDGADCEKRAFCELAVLGGRPEGNTAQRGLWKLANSIPTQYAATLGLDQLLKAVRSNSCSSLKCVDSNRSAGETRTSSRKSTKTM